MNDFLCNVLIPSLVIAISLAIIWGLFCIIINRRRKNKGKTPIKFNNIRENIFAIISIFSLAFAILSYVNTDNNKKLIIGEPIWGNWETKEYDPLNDSSSLPKEGLFNDEENSMIYEVRNLRHEYYRTVEETTTTYAINVVDDNWTLVGRVVLPEKPKDTLTEKYEWLEDANSGKIYDKFTREISQLTTTETNTSTPEITIKFFYDYRALKIISK